MVAPMSGHFATLLRATVRTMLPDHDVYITDWHNARDVPLSEGQFGFDDYVGHLIHFLQTMGEGAHMVAVCQPAVPGPRGGSRDGAGEGSRRPAQHDPDGRPGGLPHQPDGRECTRDLQAHRLVREEPDRDGPDAPQGRRPQGVSGLHAGLGLHGDERQAPYPGSRRSLLAHGQRRARESRGDRDLLRRVFRRARSCGRILPGKRSRPCSRITPWLGMR